MRETEGRADVIVIGAGIVGLATARALQQRDPAAHVLVLEREAAPALHQTGRNSGVIHTGLYYTPGSDKARLCRRGHASMLSFCEEHGVPVRRCGKVIVALQESERPGLAALAERAAANGVPVRILDARALAEIEPHVAGVEALHVPGAAITDYAAVARRLLRLIEHGGGALHTGAEVRRVTETRAGLRVETPRGTFTAPALIACAGLGARRVAHAAGARPTERIVPFRGRYRELAPAAADRVSGLVYPVPDPELPFLGVHLTPTLDGRVLCGPNAAPAWRTGPADGVQDPWWRLLAWPGAWRLLWRHRGAGWREWRRAAEPGAFTAAVRRLLPSLREDELREGPSGIRAQAVSNAGALLEDFRIIHGGGAAGQVWHVLNAPSPAATAALAIGEELARRVLDPAAAADATPPGGGPQR